MAGLWGRKSGILLAPARRYPQARVDLGFFGAPGLPRISAPATFWSAIRRACYGGCGKSDDWAGVVAINAFAPLLRSTARDAAASNRRRCARCRRASRATRKHCVESFPRLASARARDQRRRKRRALTEGLDLLRDFDAAPCAAGGPGWCSARKTMPSRRPPRAEDLAQVSGGSAGPERNGRPWTALDRAGFLRRTESGISARSCA